MFTLVEFFALPQITSGINCKLPTCTLFFMGLKKRDAAALFEAEQREEQETSSDREAAAPPVKRTRSRNWQKPELLVLFRNAVRYRDLLTLKHPPSDLSKKALKDLQGTIPFPLLIHLYLQI